MSPYISIIIPTLNEEDYILTLLKNLKHQTYKNFEIIIADAFSKDKTREIAEKFKAKIVNGGTPSIGRNNGASAARGEILIFFDADVEIKTNYLEKGNKRIYKK